MPPVLDGAYPDEVIRDALVEREDQIRVLENEVADTATRGCLVLVSGEAGFGKTSLVKELTKRLDHRYRVLIASCEPVGIPAAFAPLYELFDKLPDDLRRDIVSGSGRTPVYSGMLDLLKNDRIVMVLEDVHWSDEATLGLVRYVGRRIEATNSCLIVTYRSEELDLNPPLQLVVADLGPVAVRIELPALTKAGVERMSHGVDIDPDALHNATLGNPFFVEQVIRHPDLALPPTVQNAVLASAGQLPSDALEILYAVALSPVGIDLALAESLHPDAGRFLDLALQRRLIEISHDRVACRHDLIRESLARAIPASMSRRLHRSLLAFLEETGGDSADIARRAYHSIGAGNAEKALSYSLQAAADAARAGAHRQAAFHYDNALHYSKSMAGENLSATLLEAAHEHCLINAFDRARDLAKMRLRLAPDPGAEARARAWLSFFESRKNDFGASRKEARLAIDALAGEAPCEELALALGVAARVELGEGTWDAAVKQGDEASAHARALGSLGVEIYATTTAATARSLLGHEDGVVLLEEAARRGVESRLGEFAARALNNRGRIALSRGRLEEARHWFDQMIDYSTANELDAWYIAGVVTRAQINVLSGQWEAADRDLEVTRGQRTCISTEVEALVTSANLASPARRPRQYRIDHRDSPTNRRLDRHRRLGHGVCPRYAGGVDGFAPIGGGDGPMRRTSAFVHP